MLTTYVDYQCRLPMYNVAYQCWLPMFMTYGTVKSNLKAISGNGRPNLKDMNRRLTDSPTWIQEMLAHLKRGVPPMATIGVQTLRE